MFDGTDDHVTLPSIHTLGLTDRYKNRGLPLFLNVFSLFRLEHLCILRLINVFLSIILVFQLYYQRVGTYGSGLPHDSHAHCVQ